MSFSPSSFSYFHVVLFLSISSHFSCILHCILLKKKKTSYVTEAAAHPSSPHNTYGMPIKKKNWNKSFLIFSFSICQHSLQTYPRLQTFFV